MSGWLVCELCAQLLNLRLQVNMSLLLHEPQPHILGDAPVVQRNVVRTCMERCRIFLKRCPDMLQLA